MRKYNCSYLTGSGDSLEESLQSVVAVTPEAAAALYSKRYPEEYPGILVEWGSGESQIVSNILGAERAEARLQEKAKEMEASQLRIEPLKKLQAKVQDVEGNLAELSCSELDALVENLKDFPDMHETLSAEERAVREALYKVAFLDRNLQAGLQTKEAELQTEIQRELLGQIKSALTGQPTADAASLGESNLAKGAAMMGMAALQKLNQIEENTEEVSEGLGFD